eukprot:CAMPEP_0168600902 /NCGR_PEP_ID=MMETSP0420-20121227/13095_1 /TAXON_ID=498008 /ORGANISM="Pessonella sp." /LENGTH=106 /DNA_ID=CAMNT_0008639151 /DNA_START=144 /DNA_END=461 /DNA_ORIENTATION=+
MSEVRGLLSDMNSTLKSLESFKLQFGRHQVGLAAAQLNVSDFRQKAELQKSVNNVASALEMLVNVPDELDAHIVERQFERAVRVVERARSVQQAHEALEPQLVASG